MERTNLIPRPFNGKDLTDDWVEHHFGEYGWLSTPIRTAHVNSYLSYLKGVLTCICWRYDHNELSFRIIHDIQGDEVYKREKRNKLFDYLIGFFTNFEADERDSKTIDDYHSAIKYVKEGDRITFYFYWEFI